MNRFFKTRQKLQYTTVLSEIIVKSEKKNHQSISIIPERMSFIQEINGDLERQC